MPASLRARLLALVTLLLHVVGAGAVPLADALAERGALTVAAHVESRDAQGCAAAHDHLACTLCRVIAGAAGELPLLQPLAGAPRSQGSARARFAERGAGAERWAPGDRAPPTA